MGSKRQTQRFSRTSSAYTCTVTMVHSRQRSRSHSSPHKRKRQGRCSTGTIQLCRSSDWTTVQSPSLVAMYLEEAVLSVSPELSNVVLLDSNALHIDGMAYTRGASDDYDRLANVSGDKNWSWDNLVPYFLRVGRPNHWCIQATNFVSFRANRSRLLQTDTTLADSSTPSGTVTALY